MICLRKSGVSWEIVSDLKERLDAILHGEAEIVKQSPVKLVTTCVVGGQRFYVKRYRHAVVPFRGLKFLFKPSQARQEWTIAQNLESLGIPIVRHVALGERWGLRGLAESILITEGFPGQTLEGATAFDPAAILKFVGRMHDHGILQQDLHAGNLLRSASGELRLVDLHGIVVRSQLSPDERTRNLARLSLSVNLPLSPAAQTLAKIMRRELYATRSKRCLKYNRDFAPRKHGQLHWQVRLQFITAAVEVILKSPDVYLAERAKLFKNGRCSTVGAGDGLVVKRYNYRDIGNLAKDSFRRSRARRAFLKAYHLELVGIPTPRPIAAGDWRAAGLPVRSYMIMEEIRGAVELNQWSPAKGRVAAKVGQLVARLHTEGFRHRDLKDSNILLDPDGTPYLIDLEGLRYMGTVPKVRVRFDLNRLARSIKLQPQFTRADRIAFLHAYCKGRRIRPRELLGD